MVMLTAGKLNDKRPMGKCSHGGRYDESALVQPRGGINSESFDGALSPKHLYHSTSAQYAIEASQAFLGSGKTCFVSRFMYMYTFAVSQFHNFKLP